MRLYRLAPTLAAVCLAAVLPMGPTASAFPEDPPEPPEPKWQDVRKCEKYDGACACRRKKDNKCKEWLDPGNGWVCTSTNVQGTTNCDPNTNE
jgi:hypothetical protein